MDWQGIEWVVPIFEVIMLALPVYAYITFYRRVKCGVLKKSRALWSYASLVITPILLHILFFFVLVGLEEITHKSVITEGLSRTLPLLVGLGFAIWLIAMFVFGVTLVIIKSQPSSSRNTTTS